MNVDPDKGICRILMVDGNDGLLAAGSKTSLLAHVFHL